MGQRSSALVLEGLEARRLLSMVVEGVEADGDVWEIKLNGAGTVTHVGLTFVTLAGTTSTSRLEISVTEVHGDGLVAVGNLDTQSANLGRLKIDGDLGGLNAAKLNRLEVGSFGKLAGNKVFLFDGKVDRVVVSGGVFNAMVIMAGDVGRLDVGRREDGSSGINHSEIRVLGDLQKLRLKQSLTAGSDINVFGKIGSIDIDKHVVSSRISSGGDIGKFNVDGGISHGSTIEVAGDLHSLKVRKSVSNTTFNLAGDLLSAKFGNDLRDSLVLAKSLQKVTVKDDLNDTQIGVTGDLVSLKVGDSQGLTVRVAGGIGVVQVKRGLENALLSVLNDIDTIKVGGDMNGTTIIAGVNIGDDFLLATADDSEWGDLTIGSILVKGDMIDSSIAAGIRPNGLFFGDGDDTATNNHVGTARINKVLVKGQIMSTSLPGEMFAITADDGVDVATSQGREFTGVAGVVLQEF